DGVGRRPAGAARTGGVAIGAAFRTRGSRPGRGHSAMRVIDDGPAVLARSPAKLNLFLAVRGRRPDGFHEIETLMVKVGVFDALRFSPRADVRLTLAV